MESIAELDQFLSKHRKDYTDLHRTTEKERDSIEHEVSWDTSFESIVVWIVILDNWKIVLVDISSIIRSDWLSGKFGVSHFA